MPRRLRYRIPDVPQHVIKRGNNRQRIFLSDGDFLKFRLLLHEGSARCKLLVHAYVLMNNHVHLLVSPRSADSVSRAIQWVASRYAQWFNVKYQRSGTMWEGRYRATVVDTDQYFLTCARYIDLNPVRAQVVDRAEDYPWSSCGHYVSGYPDPIRHYRARQEYL